MNDHSDLNKSKEVQDALELSYKKRNINYIAEYKQYLEVQHQKDKTVYSEVKDIFSPACRTQLETMSSDIQCYKDTECTFEASGFLPDLADERRYRLLRELHGYNIKLMECTIAELLRLKNEQ